jgi:hypothetical protein
MSYANFSLSFRDLTEEFLKTPSSTNKNLLSNVSKSITKLLYCDESEQLDLGIIFTSLSKLYSTLNSDLLPLIDKVLDSESFAPHLKFYASLFPKHPYVKNLLFPHFSGSNEKEQEVYDPEMILARGHSATRKQATIAIKRCKNYLILKSYFSAQLRQRPVGENGLLTNDIDKERSNPKDFNVTKENELGTGISTAQSNKRIKVNDHLVSNTQISVETSPRESLPEAGIQLKPLLKSDEDLINSIIFEK